MQTIKDVLLSIIGEYTPDITAEGIAQIDWVWIAGAVLLIGLICCFFKSIRYILGVMFK